LRTADFLFSIRHIASNTVHRDILSLGLLRSLCCSPPLQSYCANYSAFCYARNLFVKKLLCAFMLGEKSLYWMIFLLLSFSALNVYSDEILKIYSSE
jgi:hypothetical protein